MRLVVTACLFMVAVVGAASAQEPESQALWAPDIGGEVRVTRHDGVKTTGTFRSLDAEAVRLLVADQQIEVSRDAIARIERRGDSLWNGFIIGAVVGILPVALATLEVEGGGNRGFAIVTGVGVYGLIGAGVDSMRKGWTTVYEGTPVPKTTRRRQLWAVPSTHGMRVGYARRF